MADAITLKRACVPIGRAAHAAGLTPPVLRAALSAFPLLGEAERTGATWRRFAPVDVVRLAVLRRLLRFGLPVSTAASIIARTLDCRLGGLVGCGIDVPPVLIVGQLYGYALHASPTPGGDWSAKIAPTLAATGPHETTLVLNLAAVASDALDRLKHKERL